MFHDGFIFSKKGPGEVENIEQKFLMIKDKFTGLKDQLNIFKTF